jgi:alkanesulfonate monooxygenase SsuD/methylene tetrahydromethanopterin reductase-like flavin-dependent oxidoreductase (luciferase family)
MVDRVGSLSGSESELENGATRVAIGSSPACGDPDGGLPLVGTPEQVVEGMLRMSEGGVDGITVSWVNYESGLAQFGAQILSLIFQADLRQQDSPAD